MARTQNTRTKEYALYKGEEFIMIGSALEIASYLNCKASTIYALCNKCRNGLESPKRLFVLLLEEDDE